MLSVDVCQLLQPVVEEIASDVCEVCHCPLTHKLSFHCIYFIAFSLQQPSYSERAKQTKQLFCRLIGKLFLDASYSQFKE